MTFRILYGPATRNFSGRTLNSQGWGIIFLGRYLPQAVLISMREQMSKMAPPLRRTGTDAGPIILDLRFIRNGKPNGMINAR
jgi:hypothetical protein